MKVKTGFQTTPMSSGLYSISTDAGATGDVGNWFKSYSDETSNYLKRSLKM
jgi:hypothetical protein